jgi:hypothetical protein
VVAIAIAAFKLPWLGIALGSVLTGLIVVWLYAGATGSCACVLYTAVSREELPSLYRLRTAHRVMERLGPRIREVQGALPENWAQEAETCGLGPRDPLLLEIEREGSASVKGEAPRPAQKSRTLASGIFLACLFGDGALTVVDLISRRPWLEWVMNALILTYLVAAIWIFIQHQRKILRAGMHVVALAALLLLGVTFYALTFTVAFQSARMGKQQPMAIVENAQAAPRMVREIYAGGALILVVAGVFLSFRPSE